MGADKENEHLRMRKSLCRYYRIADVVIKVESDLPITDRTFLPRFKLFEVDGPGVDTIRHHFADPPLAPHEYGKEIYRQLEHQYVVAALSTHHRRVFIKHEGKLIKSFPFPLTGEVIKPLC